MQINNFNKNFFFYILNLYNQILSYRKFILLIILTFSSIVLSNVYAEERNPPILNVTSLQINELVNSLQGTLQIFRISSDTMSPLLNTNDLILVSDTTSFSNLKIGDIIAFYKPEGDGSIIAHRIIDISEKYGERIIVTKGDANNAIIPGTDFPIREKDYIGK